MCASRHQSEFGADHPGTLLDASNLADFLIVVRVDYGEAEVLLEDVLEHRARVLGEDHPSILNARAIRGQTLRRSCRFDEAVAEFQAILDARARAAGDQHPETVRAREDLAVALRESGRDGEAEVL